MEQCKPLRVSKKSRVLQRILRHGLHGTVQRKRDKADRLLEDGCITDRFNGILVSCIRDYNLPWTITFQVCWWVPNGSPETYVTIGNQDKARCVEGESGIPSLVYKSTGYALIQTYATRENTKRMHPSDAPS